MAVEIGGEVGVELVAEVESDGDGRLERAGVDVGEELLGGASRRHQGLGSAEPADLPAGGAERLAARRDRQRPLGHARQGGERDVARAREDEVLVDLVGDDDQVALDRHVGDEVELLAVEHLAGRVVRRVEQDQPGGRRDRRAQLVGVEPVPARRVGAQQHRHGPRPGQRDARLVAVVHRLEHDDLVADVEHAEQGAGERLGRAGRDEHLGVGVVLEAVEAALVRG